MSKLAHCSVMSIWYLGGDHERNPNSNATEIIHLKYLHDALIRSHHHSCISEQIICLNVSFYSTPSSLKKTYFYCHCCSVWFHHQTHISVCWLHLVTSTDTVMDWIYAVHCSVVSFCTKWPQEDSVKALWLLWTVQVSMWRTLMISPIGGHP